jgi:ornithine cyclodeaminase/alanine dehydrogenase-like protein (mu-crystallin family)
MTYQADVDRILYLTRKDVVTICAKLDSVAIIRNMFRLHATGRTILPDEAYLGWKNKLGEDARSLNMPGYVGSDPPALGTKIINGNIHNSQRGYPRASGLTVLHDVMTASPFAIMEGAYISSLRTASVSLLAAEELKGPEIETVAVLGAGVQAQAHIELLLKRKEHYYPHLHQIMLYDIDQKRLLDLQARLIPVAHDLDISIVNSAEKAVRKGQLILPVTTTSEGYIPFSWLQPGAIIVNVSLDDVLPDVVFNANRVIVDDWPLVKNDTRRLLGRMQHAGQLVGPDDKLPDGPQLVRRVDAQLGDIITGTRAGRQHPDDIVLVNPFGLAIEDVAIATHVYMQALEQRLGIWLER